MIQEKNVIDEYKAVTQIARGTYTILYRGISSVSQQQVAIKVWPTADAADPACMAAIRKEVGKLQQLRHPHILPILDIQSSQHEVALISHYVPGGSLQTLLQQAGGPLPLKKALHIIDQVGEALAAAHQRGIIHSNLTPHNILLIGQDAVALTDFRIKSILATITAYTGNDHPAIYKYMSPEYFQGTVTEKTDQYALGCLCYELITGQPPFSGSARATLQQKHLHEDHALPRLLNSAIPPYIEAALMQAMDKDPDRRHQDISAFLLALHPIAQSDTSGQMAVLSPFISPRTATTQQATRRQQKRPATSVVPNMKRRPGTGTQQKGWRSHRALLLSLLVALIIVALLASLLARSTFFSPDGNPITSVVQTPISTVQGTGAISPTATTRGVTPTALAASPTVKPTPPARATAPAVITQVPVTIPTPVVIITPTPVPTTQPTPVATTPPAQPTPTATPTTGNVYPVLNCIAPQPNGAYLAKFGYINKENVAVTIPIGSNNTIIPSSYNGQQPTVFSPGNQQAVLQINAPSGTSSITWVLDGTSATAGPNSVQC